MNMNESIEIDLKDFLRALIKKAWLVVLCAALLGASMYMYTVNFVTPKYQASVSIYVNNNSGNDGAYISSSDLAVALKLVSTYVNIIQSDTVLDKVIHETKLPLSTEQVRSMISAEAMGETEMFRVTVTTPNPNMSADIANAIASVAPAEISAIIEGSSAKIIDYAKVPKNQTSPDCAMSGIIGCVIGALLAVLVILLQTVMDTRIKSEEDLARICSIPVLGVIPQLSMDAKQVRKQTRR
jgi:capsular polysaccharide biosynthesis protein